MEITWYGHSCFRLIERGLSSVVVDPYDSKALGYPALKLKADIVTCSHSAPGHSNVDAVKGVAHTIMGAGEWEIGGVFITGVQTDAGSSKKAKDSGRNTLFVFDFDGINVAHLGDIRTVPSQAEVEALGQVHVALVPVGGGNALNASKAAEVISLLEPSIVIPMHYSTPACKISLEPLSRFMKEMGLGKQETLPSLKVTASTLPEETHVILLDYQRD